MEKRISILTTAFTYSEYVDESAEFAVLYLTREDIDRAKELVHILKKNDLSEGTSWNIGDCGFYANPVSGCDIHATDKVKAGHLDDYSGEVDGEDRYIRTEGAMLHIRAQGDIYFSDFLKHSDIKVESMANSLEAIDLILGMKLEDAPKFLEHETRIIREHAKQLLGKEG